MKASDTVISDEQLNAWRLTHTKDKRLLVEAQAEISFKAGYNEKAKDCEDCSLLNFNLGNKAGMKEVIELVEKMHLIRPEGEDLWESNLKEWGL